jgi:hypothetical protein
MTVAILPRRSTVVVRPAPRPQPSTLPTPVARFVHLAERTYPGPIHTVALDTTAWIRRPGIPPLPMSIRMAHRLGEAFVHDIRLGRGPLSVRIGLDAYVDGHGIMRIGRSLHTGPTYDRGALIAMWGEALTFPTAWLGRTDARWEAADDDVARLVLAAPTGDVPITVAFDPVTGFPDFCLAERHKGDGPLAPWTGRYRDWRVEDGVLAPHRLVVQWLDEPEPWLAITVRSIELDVPIDRELARARADTSSATASTAWSMSRSRH